MNAATSVHISTTGHKCLFIVITKGQRLDNKYSQKLFYVRYM